MCTFLEIGDRKIGGSYSQISTSIGLSVVAENWQSWKRKKTNMVRKYTDERTNVISWCLWNIRTYRE